MPNIETTAAETANTGSVTADWGALKELQDVVIHEEKAPETKEVAETTDSLETTKPEEINLDVKEEVKEETNEEVKTEAEALLKEAKELGLADTATKEDVEAAKLKLEEDKPLIEFKVEDIANVPQDYENGTFRALAKELGGEITEESFEAFKDNFVPRSELEKVQQLTMDNIYDSLKPETATALKLLEQGWSEEQVFAPTREIDGYLGLGDAEIVRKNFEAMGDLTEEIIDNKMESLIEDPNKLKLEADEIRILLNREKKQIIENRNNTIQQFEQQRGSVALKQKEMERTQVTDALNKASAFLGVPLSTELKQALIKKYNNGLYDNDLNVATAKAEFILQKELGDKFAQHIRNKASADAKKKETSKLLNVPPVISSAGKKVDTTKQPNDNPWGALEELKS
ncbi:hypothetical protein CCP3SC1AL1_510005 [Gammaproteobacteria bacterium]